MDISLLQQFTSLLFCFRYDTARVDWRDLRSPYTKANGKQADIWLPDTLQTYHLKSHVSGMLTSDGAAGCVGRAYVLSDAVRRDLDVPDARTDVAFCCRAHAEPIRVRLPWVRMMLFSTGVGIMELGFSCCGNAADTVEMNYFLSEVKSEQNELQFEKRLGRDESVPVTLRPVELLSRLAAPLGTIDDFDSGAGLRYIDNKPLVFSYLLFDRFPDDLGVLLFHLRTNFKGSYQVPAQELSLDTAQGLYHPFENLWWGTSLNGVVCAASLTGDTAGDRFFTETFPHNLRCTYLQLYLLRLHQRFAIQDFRDRFALVDDGLWKENGAEIRRSCEAIAELQQRAAMFKLKCLYSEPASVEHINAFDRFLAENMRIGGSFDALEAGLAQLRELSRVAKEKLEAQEAAAKKRENLRRETLLYLVTAVWSVIVFFDSAWDLAERFVGREIWFDTPWILLPAIAALAPAIKLAAELHKKNKEIRLLDAEEKKNALTKTAGKKDGTH